MNYCTECGAEVEGDETWCHGCGVRLDQSEDTGGGDGNTLSQAVIIGISLIVVGIPILIIVSAVVGTFVLGLGENVETDTSPSDTVTEPDTVSPSEDEDPTQGESTGEQSGHNEGTGVGSDGTTSGAGYQIRIQYSGEWSGAVSAVSGSRSIQGTGTETIDISGNPDVISANAQKQTANRETLTIQVLQDGEIVRESQTNAEYGIASVTYSSY
jgi:hypothetical protein